MGRAAKSRPRTRREITAPRLGEVDRHQAARVASAPVTALAAGSAAAAARPYSLDGLDRRIHCDAVAAAVRDGSQSAPRRSPNRCTGSPNATRHCAPSSSSAGRARSPRRPRWTADRIGQRSRLAGVPVAMKDNIAVAGEPLRNGSLATPSGPATADHPVVARLRAAGAIIVGITAVPELCIWGSTDSPAAITRNPWDTNRSPGGSSGGSAAAVASGMVPIAHAADGLGSIRVPAASCGLFGIKPGLGVVPAELGPNSWFGMAENGPLATTVADAALMLSVMAGRPELAEVLEAPALADCRCGQVPAGAAANRPALDCRDRGCRRAAVRPRPHRDGRRAAYAVVAPISRWLAGPALDAEGLDRDSCNDAPGGTSRLAAWHDASSARASSRRSRSGRIGSSRVSMP